MSGDRDGGGKADLDIFEGLGRRSPEKTPAAPDAPTPPPGPVRPPQTTLLGIPGPAVGGTPPPPPPRTALADLEIRSVLHPDEHARLTERVPTGPPPPEAIGSSPVVSSGPPPTVVNTLMRAIPVRDELKLDLSVEGFSGGPVTADG